MKRSRRKSLDLSEERSRKKKEPRQDLWFVPPFLEKKVSIIHNFFCGVIITCNVQLELCERLYEFLRECKDAEGQFLSEFLVRIPSRRSAPEYYQIIQKPIDLLRIHVS